ncbi:hypothetical protein ASD58_16690 [Duganella sp. Root1480D1]|nr:hypothetical protein ASD58_16690 [Duganella sp. Root1480D1]
MPDSGNQHQVEGFQTSCDFYQVRKAIVNPIDLKREVSLDTCVAKFSDRFNGHHLVPSCREPN